MHLTEYNFKKLLILRKGLIWASAMDYLVYARLAMPSLA